MLPPYLIPPSLAELSRYDSVVSGVLRAMHCEKNDQMSSNTYIAPSLLQYDNHAVILIDQQYLQLLAMRSRGATLVTNAMALLAKGARLFRVKTLLTTAFAERQALIKEVQAVFPEQTPIDRTTLNAFEDQRVVAWAANTGLKKLVLAGLWTESCLAMSALSAISAGSQVYIITDASGGGSKESYDMAVLRMVQAGATPLTAGTWNSSATGLGRLRRSR
jgi:nicotinamidase-related amidase